MRFLIPPNDPLWYAVRAELLKGDEPPNPWPDLVRDQDPYADMWVASHQLEAQWEPDVVVQESAVIQYERYDPLIHIPVEAIPDSEFDAWRRKTKL